MGSVVLMERLLSLERIRRAFLVGLWSGSWTANWIHHSQQESRGTTFLITIIFWKCHSKRYTIDSFPKTEIEASSDSTSILRTWIPTGSSLAIALSSNKQKIGFPDVGFLCCHRRAWSGIFNGSERFAKRDAPESDSLDELANRKDGSPGFCPSLSPDRIFEVYGLLNHPVPGLCWACGGRRTVAWTVKSFIEYWSTLLCDVSALVSVHQD